MSRKALVHDTIPYIRLVLVGETKLWNENVDKLTDELKKDLRDFQDHTKESKTIARKTKKRDLDSSEDEDVDI